MTTQTQARDDINALIKATLATLSVPKVIWDDKKDSKPTDGSEWVRVTVRHADSDQTTVGGPTGTRRFLRWGQVWCSVFTPFGDGLTRTDVITTALRIALESTRTANGVIFRGVKVQEVGQDAEWHHTNVIAYFEYEEIR